MNVTDVRLNIPCVGVGTEGEVGGWLPKPVAGPGGQRVDGSENTGVFIHVQTAVPKSGYLEYL